MQYSDDAETVAQVLYVHQMIRDRIGSIATKNSLHPMWYRGLSDVQMNAIKTLQAALADDLLEGTAYRVAYVLRLIGLHPRPSKRGLFKLMRMSRGNEVAFLWFVMETYYMSDHQDNIYGSNEQIIMSCIFWLDLYPTLHALDRVLPLPHASEETRRKEAQAELQRNKLERQKKLRELREKQKPAQSSYAISPYFENPVKFKFRRSNLLAFRPKVPANLPVVPSDANEALQLRWFGNLDLEASTLVTNPLLRNEINNILSTLHAAKLNDSDVKSLCTHHKKIQEMQQSLSQNLERIKQQQLEQLMDVEYKTRQRQRRRILEQLDRLTQHYRAQFRDMAIKTRLTATRKQLCAKTHDPDFIYVERASDELREQTCCLLEGVEPLPPSCRDNTPPKVECRQTYKKVPTNACNKQQFLQVGDTDMEKTTKVDRDLLPSLGQCSDCRECDKYFSTSGNTYKFNYHKLFTPSSLTTLDTEQMWQKTQFIKALDEDLEYLSAVLEGNESGSVTALVDRSVKRLFQEGTTLFRQEYDKFVAENTKPIIDQRLDFGQKYYDANNVEQMKTMLRLGLERIAHDHRLVLPTLPDVQSVPLMIEWICARYGKLYSDEDRKRNLKRSNELMSHLNLIMRKEIVRRDCHRPVISLDKLSSIREQKKMSRLLKQYWVRFMKYFVVSMMELGRIFQTSMQIDRGVAALYSYYAYMPAHIRDVDIIRIMPSINRRKNMGHRLSGNSHKKRERTHVIHH